METLGKHFFCFFLKKLGNHEPVDGNSYEEAIKSKRFQSIILKDGNKGTHGNDGGDEGNTRADEKERDIGLVEKRKGLEKIVSGRAHDDGDSGDKGVFSRSFTAHTKYHAAHDGGGGTGEAWPQGEALETADAKGLLHGELIQSDGWLIVLTFGHDFFHYEHKYTADDKGGRYAQWCEQRFDEAVESKTKSRTGQSGEYEEQYAAQARKRGGTWLGEEQTIETPPIQGEYSQDGTDLNDHTKSCRLGALKAEETGSYDQMTRRRDGQKFCEAFH